MTNYPDDWDVRRRQVYQRDQYKCGNCNSEGGPYGDTELHAHHIVPKNSRGSDQFTNLVTLCADCHSRVHPDNEEMQECREPRDQPLEVVEDISPDHTTMCTIVEYEDGEMEKTEKALRISETKYLVVTTTHGRIENYIVDCKGVVCDCPNYRKMQEEDKEEYICNHMKAVIYDQGPGAEMLRERLPEDWKIQAVDSDIHNIE
jgi:nitrogen regulatory protein PII-like uncharacterized protein